MNGQEQQTVWLVTRTAAPLPGGVFLTEQAARDYIARHSITGTLSEFPLGESTYDHAIRLGLFRPKNDKERSGWFIAEFSPRLPHYHFTDGSPDPPIRDCE
jgi:hypothetical protein